MRQEVKDMRTSDLICELAFFVGRGYDSRTAEDWARHREVQAELDRRIGA